MSCFYVFLQLELMIAENRFSVNAIRKEFF